MVGKLIQHRFRRTSLIAVGCMAAVGGVGLARIGRIDADFVLVTAALSLLSLRRRSLVTLVFVGLLGLNLGLVRGQVYMGRLADYKTLSLQKVTIVGVAQDDGVYDAKTQLTFPLGNLKVVGPNPINLVGKIKASGFGEAAVYRGDRVEVSGKLYPTRGSNQASLGFANLKVLARGNSVVDVIRRKFVAGMQSALPEPLASFGLGLLIGQRSTLPSAISSQLTATGLTHIIAVSGYNLTILIEVARRVLAKRSKFQTLAASLALLGGFLLLAGSSASITRAALVSILSLAAWYYGRQVRPVTLIAFAVAATALANPLYAWSDIGWYLSFLAFYGVLVLAPLLQKRLFHGKNPSALSALLIESFCAQAMTIPIILYIFGQVSLVALPANALVIALVPLGMLLTVIAGLAGMLAGAVAGWLAWPARILLTYMLDVVNVLSRVPHAFVGSLSLPVAQMLGLYGLVVVLSVILWHKTKTRRSATLPPKYTEVTTGQAE